MVGSPMDLQLPFEGLRLIEDAGLERFHQLESSIEAIGGAQRSICCQHILY